MGKGCSEPAQTTRTPRPGGGASRG